jgi:uncharacterized membrane protein YhiD involved in acid resistance
MTFRLLFAIALDALIGFKRKLKHKHTDLRPQVLVCLFDYRYWSMGFV